MGAQLVSLMLAHWAPQLNDRCFRVLTRMALTALDRDQGLTPAAHYFGGEELLILTLKAERDGSEAAARRTVRRAIADLIALGAIERVTKGYPGHNAVFKLLLER